MANDNCPKVSTAFTLLNEQTTSGPRTIITFCERLDRALRGGIHLGHVTELAGPASIGKTQFCFQLAVDIQFPREFGGVAGEAIYIDTECSYKPKRVEEIANAAVRHIGDVAVRLDLQAAAEPFTIGSILNGIHVKRCLDLSSLEKTIQELETFVRSRPKIKLIIVDSLAFHFRDDQWMVRDRRRLLLKSVLILTRIASSYDLAVVAVNQMTTRFTVDGGAYEEPTFSELLSQNVGDQIVLGWRRKKTKKNAASKEEEEEETAERCAVLYKSSHGQRILTPYQVCKDGIRDLISS